MKSIKDCEYTAFISYAHADDTAHFDWVTQFCRELHRVLPAVARIPRLPPLHQSGLNGPVAGVLSDELKANVAASFAMVIVVGENYVHSQWCLRELEYFRELFGEQGFRERLFIVAMSEPAALELATKPAWKSLMTEGDQLWLGFFKEEDRRLPIDVYAGERMTSVSPRFTVPFRRLLDEFAARLKADAAQALRAPVAPGRPAPVAAASAGATAAAATALSAAGAGRVLLGWAAPGSAAAVSACAQALDQRGLAAHALAADVLATDFADFADARSLVLVVDEQPLMAAAALPGGHLQMQREAWLRKGGDPEQVLLLDARARADSTESADWAQRLGLALLPQAALLDRLAPVNAKADPSVPSAQPVRIYIESNRHERTLWRALGEQVQAKWERVCAELAPGRMPPLAMRPRGLPVDDLDAFPHLDDADGVVLLWGKKTSEALVAQIDKVEAKLPGGAYTAPGIVAYLMPPQHSTEPMPAWGWQVLRFDARDEDRVAVVDAERDDLHRFLVEVFHRHRARIGAQP